MGLSRSSGPPRAASEAAVREAAGARPSAAGLGADPGTRRGDGATEPCHSRARARAKAR